VRRSLAGLALIATCSSAAPAFGATTCNGSNVSLAFGPYDVASPTSLDTQTAMTVSCTRVNNPPGDISPGAVTIVVGVGASQTSGSIQNRQLGRAGGGTVLNYNIYLDAGRLSVWGNSPGTDTASQTLNIPNKATRTATFTFYGRVFALQDVTPGFYNDSLLVTVNY
jgi:spore coat protein U-like protein